MMWGLAAESAAVRCDSDVPIEGTASHVMAMNMADGHLNAMMSTGPRRSELKRPRTEQNTQIDPVLDQFSSCPSVHLFWVDDC